MKTFARIFSLYSTIIIAAGLFVFLALTPGCGTTAAVSTNGQAVSGSFTNESGGGTVTYDPVTGQWSGGLVITFPKAPDADVSRLLGEAGAVAQRDGLAYLLPRYSRLNIDQQVALETSLRAGATLRQAK